MVLDWDAAVEAGVIATAVMTTTRAGNAGAGTMKGAKG